MVRPIARVSRGGTGNRLGRNVRFSYSLLQDVFCRWNCSSKVKATFYVDMKWHPQTTNKKMAELNQVKTNVADFLPSA